MPLGNLPYHKCLENDLPEEEIEEFESDEQNQIFDQPKDSYYLTYITLCVLGLMSLLPASFFVVSNEYWMYKFRDVTKNTTHNLNPLQVSYTSSVTIIMSASYLFFCIINGFINQKISSQIRIFGCLITMFILLLITGSFVLINTNSWQYGFLAITFVTVAVLSAASAIFASTMAGIISKFSPQYITSFILGQGLSGTFSSLSQIISLAIGAVPTSSALIYFVIGCVTVLIALTLHIFLQRNVYFAYISTKKNEIGINEFEIDLIGPPKVCYQLIFKKIWHYILCCFIGLVVTHNVSPGVTVLIKSYGTGIWSDVYFIPLTTFLIPNVVDCCGRLLAGFTEWPKNRNVLIVLNVVRICMIPIILFCNVQPRGNLPVLFNSDGYYIAFNAFLSFSNGYILNISVINVTKVIEHHEKYTAGLILSIFIALGVNIGSLFSMLYVKII